MAVRKKTLKKKLKERFPEIEFFDHDEFGFSAESGSTDDPKGEGNGMPLADYYDYHHWDPNEKYNVHMISRKLWEYVRELGWWTEWINPGMVALHKD